MCLLYRLWKGGEQPVWQFLSTIPLWQAFLLFLLENALILGLCVWVGNLLVRRYSERPVAAPARPDTQESVLAAVSVLLNTLVTWLGLILWRMGVIELRTTLGWRDWLDALVLLVTMDLAMYLLHRIAHLPLLYPLLHRTHHRYEDPRPLTLFALNPLENLSFGLLWLLVLCLYQSSWAGVIIYLTLNVAFGLVGHLGVEPFSKRWIEHPILKYISTSTFHAQHHQQDRFNYGFYTVIWDRLFGTLSPQYPSRFGQPPE